jgi:hypothetical protein
MTAESVPEEVGDPKIVSTYRANDQLRVIVQAVPEFLGDG